VRRAALRPCLPAASGAGGRRSSLPGCRRSDRGRCCLLELPLELTHALGQGDDLVGGGETDPAERSVDLVAHQRDDGLAVLTRLREQVLGEPVTCSAVASPWLTRARAAASAV
jgi:hypothetical protein